MDIPTQDDVIAEIERFLARHDMAPTRFGARATGEPQLLASLRAGRSPSLKVLHRIADFIAAHDGCAVDAHEPVEAAA